jgi:DNA-binding response OmpR family regulator
VPLNAYIACAGTSYGYKKLLVVDDQEEFHQLIKAVLKDSRVEVMDAFDGDEALEAVQREQYDLISLDLMMPVATGGDFIRNAIHHVLILPPVVVMSSMGDANLIRNILGVGATAFIHKPIDAGELREAVKKLLRI